MTVSLNNTKEIETFKFKYLEIDESGIASLRFNKKMVVPLFGNKTIETLQKRNSSRILLSMDELDILRDILDITFLSNSDTLPKNFTYKMEIEEWTEEKFDILLNFSDPLAVSRGAKFD